MPSTTSKYNIMIPIFIYTKVYSTPMEWTEIAEQRVFLNMKEAQRYMRDEVERTLNGPGDDWHLDYGGGIDDTDAHLSCHKSEDELVISILEDTIY